MDEGSMFGPLSNQSHFHKVKHYLDMAKANNRIIAGGEALDQTGYFVQPTLISFKIPTILYFQRKLLVQWSG